jgi:hypothetical protein
MRSMAKELHWGKSKLFLTPKYIVLVADSLLLQSRCGRDPTSPNEDSMEKAFRFLKIVCLVDSGQCRSTVPIAHIVREMLIG